MNSLIEKMARNECRKLFTDFVNFIPNGKSIDDMVEQEWKRYVDVAKEKIEKVLDHFSDPANVTQRMDHAAWDDAQTLHETRPIKTVIAAAMKAAKDELK